MILPLQIYRPRENAQTPNDHNGVAFRFGAYVARGMSKITKIVVTDEPYDFQYFGHH